MRRICPIVERLVKVGEAQRLLVSNASYLMGCMMLCIARCNADISDENSATTPAANKNYCLGVAWRWTIGLKGFSGNGNVPFLSERYTDSPKAVGVAPNPDRPSLVGARGRVWCIVASDAAFCVCPRDPQHGPSRTRVIQGCLACLFGVRPALELHTNGRRNWVWWRWCLDWVPLYVVPMVTNRVLTTALECVSCWNLSFCTRVFTWQSQNNAIVLSFIRNSIGFSCMDRGRNSWCVWRTRGVSGNDVVETTRFNAEMTILKYPVGELSSVLCKSTQCTNACHTSLGSHNLSYQFSCQARNQEDRSVLRSSNKLVFVRDPTSPPWATNTAQNQGIGFNRLRRWSQQLDQTNLWRFRLGTGGEDRGQDWIACMPTTCKTTGAVVMKSAEWLIVVWMSEPTAPHGRLLSIGGWIVCQQPLRKRYGRHWDPCHGPKVLEHVSNDWYCCFVSMTTEP